MGKIIYFNAHMVPSNMCRRLRAHNGDISFSSKPKRLGVRIVLGRKVIFYEDGTHLIKNEKELTEEEQFKSELLRFVHASLLIEQPVGDKKRLWVDARTNPVKIWMFNLRAEYFLEKALLAMHTGRITNDFVLDQSIDFSKEKIKNERDVRLFGNRSYSSHLQISRLDESDNNCDSFVYYNTS